MCICACSALCEGASVMIQTKLVMLVVKGYLKCNVFLLYQDINALVHLTCTAMLGSI